MPIFVNAAYSTANLSFRWMALKFEPTLYLPIRAIFQQVDRYAIQSSNIFYSHYLLSSHLFFL
ncbi:hypothetical protein QWZ13_14200 [Reinekea marina]|uniref:hypothetical protein n=1 Tax=Reinekea marina TaxID=1310421 RepID=UPI0025B44E22|nr:hypothetical protein [Reinekea marina]MDN3650068.1 hypothetical protein [Reinekea marina]